MADRRQSYSFRFWPTRRTQTPSPPPATTNSPPAARPTPQSRPISRQATTNRPAEIQSPSRPPSTTNLTPAAQSRPVSRQTTTTNLPAETQSPPQPPSTTNPPPTTEKVSGRPPNSNSPPPTPSMQKISPPNETKTSSPSTPIKPASLSNKSKSPPQTSSSPSRLAPQASPIKPPSPSHNSKASSTPQTRSLSRSTSKQTSSNSPKKPPNSPSNKPNLMAPQQELQPKAEAKSNTAANNDINGTKTQNELLPPENLPSSIINDEHEPLTKLKTAPEETMHVKEVVQAIENKDDEKITTEANSIPNPMSSSQGLTPSEEKPEVLLERKETLPTSLPSLEPTSNNTASQPKKIMSTVEGIRDKAAQENGEHISSNKEIKNDVSKFLNQMALGDPKNAFNEKNVSIITLAGENRGASMQMGPTAQKDGPPVHISRGYKVNPGEIANTTNNGEESSKGKKPSDDAKATAEGQPTEAYVNNNTQGINNSIVFNASIAERNPGVHFVVTHVPKESIWTAAEKISPAEARKAEYNMTQAEKITYDPLVRRRCLRGLLLETSDSDIENPEKPRRHGCRVGCQQKEKENNADIS
ncbi:isoflavone reductase family protein [Striga asiatica]|uniref:Isoflavone reductase family protein n=1 Tax=Striga asiatica TaxID=4170 RepID=A0A5A7PSE7_STRAF|nr:isoflavone reductase family protein [Striga asiatica]